ncbi:MAG TPA: PilZ domain-containing protein [Pyrinomonadaceae bacterium]|nr:PilZ domain-containing protein [Pyrinomonadaceae bacterium]
MSEERPWKRIRDRLELQLPVRVHCRETPDFAWTEITRLVDVTPFGAGFTLKRPTEKGRLLHMTIPMPRQLRVFDHVEDQYRVWSLVRYLRSISSDRKEPKFEVGVAFIGKRPPASYEQDPAKRYEISQAQSQSMLTSDMVAPITTSDQRAHTRHSIAVDVIVELLDEKNFLAQSEHTVTENLSLRGATLFTTLDIPLGRFIHLRSDQYQVSLFAVVRSKSTGTDGIPRIHVEFIDREWPL